MGPFQNGRLHIEFLPVYQIQFAELSLQHGLEITLQIAAEGPYRLGNRIRQAARQLIQSARINKTHKVSYVRARTPVTHVRPKPRHDGASPEPVIAQPIDSDAPHGWHGSCIHPDHSTRKRCRRLESKRVKPGTNT